jgi:uncharacterized protein YqkB
MDERIEKAFETANYMATLSNQKRIIQEEFSQQLLFYINGSTFRLTTELIAYIKIVLDLGHTTDVAFIDSNNIPVLIDDVQKFFDDVTEQYFLACQVYLKKYADIRVKRKIKDLVEL